MLDYLFLIPACGGGRCSNQSRETQAVLGSSRMKNTSLCSFHRAQQSGQQRRCHPQGCSAHRSPQGQICALIGASEIHNITFLAIICLQAAQIPQSFSERFEVQSYWSEQKGDCQKQHQQGRAGVGTHSVKVPRVMVISRPFLTFSFSLRLEVRLSQMTPLIWISGKPSRKIFSDSSAFYSATGKAKEIAESPEGTVGWTHSPGQPTCNA